MDVLGGFWIRTDSSDIFWRNLVYTIRIQIWQHLLHQEYTGTYQIRSYKAYLNWKKKCKRSGWILCWTCWLLGRVSNQSVEFGETQVTPGDLVLIVPRTEETWIPGIFTQGVCFDLARTNASQQQLSHNQKYFSSPHSKWLRYVFLPTVTINWCCHISTSVFNPTLRQYPSNIVQIAPAVLDIIGAGGL